VSRIFFTLAAVSTLCLTGTFFLGISVDSSAAEVVGERSAADWHILLGVFGLIFAVLVHAIVLTYFMGTGRWIDETSHVYKLGDQPFRDHRKLKQRTLPLMMLAIIALIMIIPTGASVDPAASRKPIVEDTVESDAALTKQSQQENASNLHLVYVIITVFVNVAISVFEFRSIEANGEIVTGILDEVRRIRTEKGLPV
jgi:hypothetical protein